MENPILRLQAVQSHLRHLERAVLFPPAVKPKYLHYHLNTRFNKGRAEFPNHHDQTTRFIVRRITGSTGFRQGGDNKQQARQLSLSTQWAIVLGQQFLYKGRIRIQRVEDLRIITELT